MSSKYKIDNAALLVIDLQYENQSGNAWPVVNFDQVLLHSRQTIDACRKAGIPVIYTKHALAADGSDAMKFESKTPKGRPLHSVAGDPRGEICHEVNPEPGDFIINKTKFTAFYGTELDRVLADLSVETLIIIGVWTEACVETTVWDALWRNFKIVLVKDAMGTASQAMHKTAILDMANWLYGGAIYSTDELCKALDGEEHDVWVFQGPAQMNYEVETLDTLYESI